MLIIECLIRSICDYCPIKFLGAAGYYVPVCDVETCKRSCYEYLGYLIENGALCFNNECYCKEDPDEQSVTQTIIENTSSSNINTEDPTETDDDDDWDYKKQGGRRIKSANFIIFHLHLTLRI